MAWNGNYGIHHTAIRTADYEGTLAFYLEVLGFTLKFWWGEHGTRIAFLACSGTLLEIFEMPSVPLAEAPQITHFALRTMDCRAAIERVRAAGCRVLVEAQAVQVDTNIGPVIASIAHFEGPTGERIEFIEADF